MGINSFYENENASQPETVNVDAVADKEPVIYDLKSGHNGTLTIATEGIKWVLSEEKPTNPTYESGLEGTIKLSLYNYGLSIFSISNGGYCRLYLTAVPNAGADYLPKINMTINDAYYEDYQKNSKLEMTKYNLDRKINNLKNKWPNDEDTYLLDNCFSALDDMGGKIDVYMYNIPLPATLLNKWDKIVINDVTGENIAISPYHFFNFHDSETPEETPFVHIPDDGAEPENYNYLYGNINVANRWETMHMPVERMKQDSDKIFCWSRAENYSQSFPHANARFKLDGVSPWVDLQIEYDTIIWQALTGWHSDELNLSDKRYHRFKGIQWDVWVDGLGQSMSITIIPTFLGNRQDQKCYMQVGYSRTQTAGAETETYIFDDASAIKVLENGKPFDTTFNFIWYIYHNEDSPKDIFSEGKITNLPVEFFYSNKGKNDGKISCSFPSNFLSDIGDDIVAKLYSLVKGISTEKNSLSKVYDIGTGEKNNKDSSIIIFHAGLYDGDKYDDNDDITDDIEDSDGYNGVGLLTTQYALTSKRTQQLGWKLWGASFVELIEKVNNNPIENIISLKVFPRDFTGNDEVIKLGNVEMDVNGAKITNDTYSYKWDIGTFTVRKKYNSFLDFTPFTKVSIWLPFIGLKDLDTSLFMGKTVSLRYIVDIITGACKAELRYNGALLTDFEGSMGIDVSLTASNRAQVEAAFIGNTVSSVTRNIGGIVSGGAGMASEGLDTNFSGGGGKGAIVQGIANIGSDLLQSALNQYHTTSGGSPSPSCSAYQTRDAYLIYDRPTYQDLKAFNMTHGRMCMLSRSLGTLKGFTKCNAMIDLSGIPCTEEERSMLLSILSSGFFINH